MGTDRRSGGPPVDALYPGKSVGQTVRTAVHDFDAAASRPTGRRLTRRPAARKLRKK